MQKQLFTTALLLFGLFTAEAFSSEIKEDVKGGTAKASVKITTERDTDGKPTKSFELTAKDIHVYQGEKEEVTSDTIDKTDLASLMIKSPRFCFIPVKEKDAPLLHKHLFGPGNEEVMEKYASGKTYDLGEIEGRCKNNGLRFLKGDPYSDYMMYFLSETDEYDEGNFCGRLAIGHGYTKDSVQHARVVRLDNQQAGAGTEMLFVGVHLVQLFKDAGITIGKEGDLPAYMEATARVDNPGSWVSMEKVGFEIIKMGDAVYSKDDRYTLRLDIK